MSFSSLPDDVQNVGDEWLETWPQLQILVWVMAMPEVTDWRGLKEQGMDS